MQSFDIFFVANLNKLMNKEWSWQWLEISLNPCDCNVQQSLSGISISLSCLLVEAQWNPSYHIYGSLSLLTGAHITLQPTLNIISINISSCFHGNQIANTLEAPTWQLTGTDCHRNRTFKLHCNMVNLPRFNCIVTAFNCIVTALSQAHHNTNQSIYSKKITIVIQQLMKAWYRIYTVNSKSDVFVTESL